MLKQIFWSKYMAWLRKLLAADKPYISFEDILEETGGPHKVPRGYFTSFSGIDIKVYFEDSEGNFICVPEIQAISCICQPDGQARGDIIVLLFDGDVLAYLPIQAKNMLMVAANEYGTLCYQRFTDIKFCNKRWGVSIDDIVTEMVTEFSAEGYVSWKKVEDGLGKLEKGLPYLPEQILENLRRFK